MSLMSVLNLGKSALAVQQAAIQVTSNNVANAGNADYTREVPTLTPAGDQSANGLLFGSGVNLTSIQRQIDDALEGRLRDSTADAQSAQVTQQWLSQLESVFQSLSDTDLSTKMTAFSNAWSNLANKPQDASLRQIVLQDGQTLASAFRDARSQINKLQGDLDSRLGTAVGVANGLLDQVAQLNGQISQAEGGGASANSLRDQRDAILKQLSQYADIKVQDMGGGMVNVLVGSEAVVMGTTNRGLAVRQTSTAQGIQNQIVIKDDNTPLTVSSGELAALGSLREDFSGVASHLDGLAGNLIFELNKVYASGQGTEGFSQVTGGYAVNDASALLATAGLKFAPTSGSFVVHVKDKATGLVTSTLVPVDLDGQGGNDTSLTSLQDSLNGIAGVQASIVNGKLKIQSASPNLEFSFSDDSSGTLAALGINTFFTGSNASDIDVNAQLLASPGLLAAASNGEPADNQTALAVANLQSKALDGLQGSSLNDSYDAMITGIATATANANSNVQAAQTVTDTLSAQRESLSGVSLDEEAINLMREQQAFQGAAKIISAVNEMMQTLLQMT